MVLVGIFLLYQPRRSSPSLSRDSLFYKPPEHGLGESASISRNVFIGKYGFFFCVFDADQITCRWQSAGAVGEDSWAKGGLVTNETGDTVSFFGRRRHLLSRVIVLFEFVVNHVDEVVEAGDDLELNFAQDRSLEGFGKGLFDFATASKLCATLAENAQDKIVKETNLAFKRLEKGEAGMARYLIIKTALRNC